MGGCLSCINGGCWRAFLEEGASAGGNVVELGVVEEGEGDEGEGNQSSQHSTADSMPSLTDMPVHLHPPLIGYSDGVPFVDRPCQFAPCQFCMSGSGHMTWDFTPELPAWRQFLDNEIENDDDHIDDSDNDADAAGGDSDSESVNDEMEAVSTTAASSSCDSA